MPVPITVPGMNTALCGTRCDGTWEKAISCGNRFFPCTATSRFQKLYRASTNRFLIWTSLAFIKFLYPNYNQFIKLENPLDGFSFFVLSSRHIQSRSSESSPHAEIAGGNILSERNRSISFADSRLGLQSFSNNRRSPDGMLLFSEIDFRFSTTVSRVKKSNRQSDYAVRQEVYAKADTPWTRKPGEGQA